MKTMSYYAGAALLAASALAGCAQPMYTTADGRWYAAPYSHPYAAPVAVEAPEPRYVRDTVPVIRDMQGNVVALGEREVRAFVHRRAVVQGRTAVPQGYYTTGWQTARGRQVEDGAMGLRTPGRVIWEDSPYQRVSW